MKRLTLHLSCAAALILAAATTAAAQQYPPYPPPPYPPPNYPVPRQYPPQQQPRRSPFPRRAPDYTASRAYFSPYAMFTADHYSGLGVGVGTAANQSGGITPLGGTFGGYLTFPNPGPIRAGVDARLLIANSANSTPYGNKLTAGFLGFRIDGSGAQLPVVPYFQFGVGGAATNNGTQTTRNPGSFAYQAQFGADIPFSPQFSARAEYGVGQLLGPANTNHTLQSTSFGIVFHLR